MAKAVLPSTSVTRMKLRNGSGGVKVEPKFILKLQARDLTILEELKSFSDAEKSIRNQMLGLNIKIVIALKFLIVRNCKR